MYSPVYVGLSPYQITVTCLPGYAYSSTSSRWEPICGDGLKIGSEKWDDGNAISGDGWRGDCTSVEASWVWSGGSPTSRDTCTFWSSGFYQNDAANPTVWVTRWGDGIKAGDEKCDDQNNVGGDGWSSDCATVETGWIWSGGSLTAKDIWIYWTEGLYQNDVANPTLWIPHWGDGKRAGNEKWDDGNTNDRDGWKGDCTFVEPSWVWSGGTPTSKDNWTYWTSGWYQNNPANPEKMSF